MACTFVGCFERKGVFGKEGRCAKTGSDAGHRDKVLKSAIQIVKFTEQVAKVGGANQATINGLWATSAALNDARAILGIMNPINGIPRMIESLNEFRAYAHGTKTKKDAAGHDVLVSGLERILGAISAAFKFAEWALFNFIFGIVSPISFAAKHFQLGEAAKGIGNQFTLFMMCRDIATTGATIAEIGVRRIQYNELMTQVTARLREVNNKGDLFAQTCRLQQDLISAYRWSNVKMGLGLVKNSCDIAGASIGIGGYQVSKWTTLSLGLVSAIIGLVEVGWATSDPNPTEFPPRPRAG